jgi:hypothetical protein
MPVKLVQYWNILHAAKSDFDAYFTREYVPRINETGFMKMVGSWHVASGEGPYFITEGVAETVAEVESLIMAPIYIDLRNRLLQLVRDYQSKLLVPVESIQPDVPDVEHGYKFNQHFNINPADLYAFHAFEEQVHIPEMKRFGLALVGGWSVAVGATPYRIDETRADNLATIGEMLEKPAYQKLTLKLLQLVSNYGCKILVPSGHINT